MGFMKRLFGGGAPTPAVPDVVPAAAAPAPPPPPEEPDPRAAVDEARAAVGRIHRERDPLAWAEAQQLLGNALINLAGVEDGERGLAAYQEAESVLADAIATAGRDAHPGFLASMANLRGYAAYCRGDRLTGDAKADAYAEAAQRFRDAMERITPAAQRELWVDLGFYRGAALQALALLKDGTEEAACLDEAAATFRAVAEHGMADGTVHPIAAYNLHVVLQNRAAACAGRAALFYLTDSRRALLQAMEGPTFAATKPDHEARLAALDAAISAARR